MRRQVTQLISTVRRRLPGRQVVKKRAKQFWLEALVVAVIVFGGWLVFGGVDRYDTTTFAVGREIGVGLLTGGIIGSVLLMIDERREDARDEHDAELARRSMRHSLITALTVKDDLTNIVLAGQDLQDIVLSGRDLTRADLTGANLTGAKLHGATLSLVNLTGANLTGANLTGADLTRAILRKANLTGANLSLADLTRAKLRGANLTRATLSLADLTEADLTGATLDPFDRLTLLSDRDTVWPRAGRSPEQDAALVAKIEALDGLLPTAEPEQGNGSAT